MSTQSNTSQQLRLRVFAGPNGSGKSTIINGIKQLIINGKPIDFGYYINADDIARKLTVNQFSFSTYKLRVKPERLYSFAEQSGLLSADFNLAQLKKSFSLTGSRAMLTQIKHLDRVAQIFARFLRDEMLRLKRRFSFETVFSHPSNLDLMRIAKKQGYKVYLYFVSTESPEINKYRVKLRVEQGGHNVPEDRIEKRYYRSLELLKEAIDLSYQAFCFDNSNNNESHLLVAHCKHNGTEHVWDEIENNNVQWFDKYYTNKP